MKIKRESKSLNLDNCNLFSINLLHYFKIYNRNSVRDNSYKKRQRESGKKHSDKY